MVLGFKHPQHFPGSSLSWLQRKGFPRAEFEKLAHFEQLKREFGGEAAKDSARFAVGAQNPAQEFFLNLIRCGATVSALVGFRQTVGLGGNPTQLPARVPGTRNLNAAQDAQAASQPSRISL